VRSIVFSRIVPLAILISLAAGCNSGRYSVTGKVTYEDGSPLTAGTVIGEATIAGKPVGLQGNVEKDGTFSLGSAAPGDGAVPGDYRFVVMPVPLGDQEMSEGKLPAVDGKYTKFSSSGITLQVKEESNVLNITVTRPKPKPPEEKR
jgi:hypothetical protein